MGIAAYLTDLATGEKSYFPVAGASELDSLWKPIIQRKSLGYLDYIVTAGLSIDEENQVFVRDELQILLAEIQRTFSGEDDGHYSIARCQRLFDVIANFDPQSAHQLHVG